MSAYTVLQYLVTVPAKDRAEVIAALVPGVVRQPFISFRGRRGVNLVVGDPAPRVVIGAHHDIDPGTIQGAMDNTASVATLIDLVQHYGQIPAGLQLCFWDLEEPGNGGFSDGAERYARRLKEQGVIPQMNLVCDVLGVGVPWISRHSDRFTSFLTRRVLQQQNLHADVLSTPGSDDVGLKRVGFASALMCTLPANKDMRVWSAMHTRQDRIELIDPDSMGQGTQALKAIIAEYVTNNVSLADLADSPEYLEEVRTAVRESERGKIYASGPTRFLPSSSREEPFNRQSYSESSYSGRSYSDIFSGGKTSGRKGSGRKAAAGPKKPGRAARTKAEESFRQTLLDQAALARATEAAQLSMTDLLMPELSRITAPAASEVVPETVSGDTVSSSTGETAPASPSHDGEIPPPPGRIRRRPKAI